MAEFPVANEGRVLRHADPTSAMTRMTLRQKLGYGAGDLAISSTWGLSTGYLLLYWSDVALLPVVALGPIMLITRILDAAFDPIVGAIVDRTQTKLGKARPYLLWGALPFAALSVAVFSVPQVAPALKVAYAFVTFCGLGFLYSLLYIPYGALLPMLTSDRGERVQLASYRSMGTSLASLVVYSLTLPIVNAANQRGHQSGFMIAASVMGTITVVVLLGITFPNTWERPVAQKRSDLLPIGSALRQVTTNPVWLMACAVSTLLLAKMFAIVSSFPYFARDVLGDISWMAKILPLLSVVIFAGGLTASHFFRRIGLRKGNIFWLTLSIALTAIMPLFQARPIPFFTLFLLSQFGGAFQAATIFILVADAVDLQEERHGWRSEGLMMSSVSFASKLGMALGTALTGFLLAWTHYAPGVRSASTENAIAVMFYVAPIVSMLLTIICLLPYRRDEVRVSGWR